MRDTKDQWPMMTQAWAAVLAVLMFLSGVVAGAAWKQQQVEAAEPPEPMVAMQIVMFEAGPDGAVHELWRIEKETPRPVCWMMDTAFAGAGPKVVTTVKCTELNERDGRGGKESKS